MANNVEGTVNIGMRVSFDWRVFEPTEYVTHPAIHNTGNILLEIGTRYGFRSLEKIDDGTWRDNMHFQKLPKRFSSQLTETGLVLINFHQAVLIVDKRDVIVPVTHEIITQSKWLPWRKKRHTTTVNETKEEIYPIRPLTAREILKNTTSAEPVTLSEMEIGLPLAFLKGIPAFLSDQVSRLMTVAYFLPQSQDEKLKQEPLVETINYFTQFLIDFLHNRNYDQRKLEEFSEWMKTSLVQRYDFDGDKLVPVTTDLLQ